MNLSATAQTGSPQPPRPSDRPLPEPEFLPDREKPGLTLPPVEAPAPDAPLSAGPRFELRSVRFTGNTVISDRELQAVADKYLERAVSTETLEALRRELTLYYIDRGYINSGALLPDQRVENGVVEIRIVEGRLSTIAVSGTKRLRPAYVRRRLELASGPPLNVNDLRDRIEILLQDPLIDRLEATLGPGTRPGDSRLDVKVEEAKLFDLRLTLDNERAPSIGELQGAAHARIQNITGWGETLSLTHWRTDGLTDTNFHAELPVTRYDTRIFFRVQGAHSEVVQKPFDAADVKSESNDYELGIRQPLYRTVGQELAAKTSLTIRESTTSIFGLRQSFSPGVQNGRSKVTVIRGSLDWTSRSRNQVVAIRSVFSGGVDAFDATRNPDALPDGRFFSWLGQFQWARRLTESGLQLLLRADVQLTPDPLLPLEKFGVGGMHSVRGYPRNQLVRDNGWAASIEARVPLFRLPLPGLSKTASDGMVALAPFFDAGRSWNEDIPTPDPEYLASIGAGLRWRVSDRVQADIYVAQALKDVPSPPESSLQDDGIHFQLLVNPF